MHSEKLRLIEEKYRAGILGWESVSEWQQQVGHGQAEFNKQKHMCPAVPLAFPWSRVWVANLGGAAAGRERALLTFIRAESCWHRAPPRLQMPSCTFFWRCWRGEAARIKRVIPAPALQDDGQGAAVFPFPSGLLSSSEPFGRICLRLFKRRLS